MVFSFLYFNLAIPSDWDTNKRMHLFRFVNAYFRVDTRNSIRLLEIMNIRGQADDHTVQYFCWK